MVAPEISELVVASGSCERSGWRTISDPDVCKRTRPFPGRATSWGGAGSWPGTAGGCILTNSRSKVVFNANVTGHACSVGGECVCKRASGRARRHHLVLCTLFSLRLESSYLLPWIAWHSMVGFDHIFMYLDDVRIGNEAREHQEVLHAAMGASSLVTVLSLKRVGCDRFAADGADAALRRDVKKGNEEDLVLTCAMRHWWEYAPHRALWVAAWDLDEYAAAGSNPQLAGVLICHSRIQVPHLAGGQHLDRRQP